MKEKASERLRKRYGYSAVVIGAITGVINGLFGGGGGMIVVPALSKIFKKDQKTAQATAILIILPVSIVSAIVYSVFGFSELKTLVPVGVGVVLGGVAGAFLLKKTPEGVLFYVFYAIMLFAGVKMIF